jgi:hypothetical protein
MSPGDPKVTTVSASPGELVVCRKNVDSLSLYTPIVAGPFLTAGVASYGPGGFSCSCPPLLQAEIELIARRRISEVLGRHFFITIF